MKTYINKLYSKSIYNEVLYSNCPLLLYGVSDYLDLVAYRLKVDKIPFYFLFEDFAEEAILNDYPKIAMSDALIKYPNSRVIITNQVEHIIELKIKLNQIGFTLISDSAHLLFNFNYDINDFPFNLT